MNCKYYARRLRAVLYKEINRIVKNQELYVTHPGHDFTRKRKLSLQTMLSMMIGMGGGTLSKELYAWNGFSEKTATAKTEKITSGTLGCVV